MAGAFIQVNLKGQTELVATLNQLMKNGGDLSPALSQIGEYLLESHHARFQLEVAPDGTPWEPLAPETLKRKKGEDRILQDKGYLRDLLSYEASINQLLFGSNLEYAATHQFGREEDGIVQREFLGLTSGPWNDGDEILAILQDHLQRS